MITFALVGPPYREWGPFFSISRSAFWQATPYKIKRPDKINQALAVFNEDQASMNF